MSRAAIMELVMNGEFPPPELVWHPKDMNNWLNERKAKSQSASSET
jgi:predicted DNA-binding transcriptional regulator AlpA